MSGFVSCKNNPSKIENNIPQTITASDLPSNLTFCEVTEDDYVNYILESGGVKSSSELATKINKVLETECPGVTVSVASPGAGCSAFISPDGKNGFYAGRNFDFYDAMVPGAMIIRNLPSNGDYASLCSFNTGFVVFNGLEKLSAENQKRIMGQVGLLVPLDGINEKGLFIAVLNQENNPGHNLVNQQTEKKDLTTTSAVRVILNKAKNVDDAVEILKAYDLHSDIGQAHHLFISDAQGKAVTVEWDYVNADKSKQGIRVTETKFLTNHPLYKYEDGVSEENLTKDYGNSVERFKILEEGLKKGNFDFNDTKELLGKVHQSHSQWSIVYHITPSYSEETLFWKVTTKENWESEGYKFSVK